MKRPTTRRPPAPRQLLDEWTRLAHAHVPIHAGCSCGAGLGHVRIADFEQDILDYLAAKYRDAGDREAAALVRDSGGVGMLLNRLAAAAPSRAARQVAADLARPIDSFARLHRGH